MKLRNKLLTLTSSLIAASTVVPFTTSCSKQYSELATRDITQPQLPDKKAPKDEVAKTPEQAIDIYAHAVMKNPEILQQDIWYYEHQKLAQRIAELQRTDFFYDTYDGSVLNSISNVVANITCDNVSVRLVDYVDPDSHTTKQFPALSMVLNYEFAFKAITLDADPRLELDQKYSFKSTYVDVPIMAVNYNNEYDRVNEWFITTAILDGEYPAVKLASVPNWSFTYDYSAESQYKIFYAGNTYEKTTSTHNADKITRPSQIEAFKYEGATIYETLADFYINFSSYYMSDITATRTTLYLNKDAMAKTYEVEVKQDDKYTIDIESQTSLIDLFKFRTDVTDVNSFSINTNRNNEIYIPSSYVGTSKGNTLYYSSGTLYTDASKYDQTNHSLGVYGIYLEFENELQDGEEIVIYNNKPISVSGQVTTDGGRSRTLPSSIYDPLYIKLKVKIAA